MNSYLLDDYAKKKGIIIEDDLPFDDIFITEFNNEFNKHKELMENMNNNNEEE